MARKRRKPKVQGKTKKTKKAQQSQQSQQLRELVPSTLASEISKLKLPLPSIEDDIARQQIQTSAAELINKVKEYQKKQAIGEEYISEIERLENNPTDYSGIHATNQFKEFFTPDKIQTLLKGDNRWERFKEAEIDACKNFLTGAVTSPLHKVVTNSYVKDAISTASAGAGLYLKTITEGKKLLNDLTSDDFYTDIASTLIKYATNALIQKGQQLITKEVMSLIELPEFSYLQSQVMSYFFAYRNSIAYVLTQKIKDPDVECVRINDYATDSRYQKTLNWITNAANDTKKYTDMAISYANTYLELVMTYHEMGPQWVAKQMNNVLDKGYQEIVYYIEPKVQWVNQKKAEYIQKQVERVGQKLVNEYNKQLDKAATEIITTNDSAKRAAKMNAYRQMATGKLKIMELTGIKLPIPGCDF